MLLYLVPQTPGTGEASSTDIVAKVGDETVSAAEVRQQLAEIEQRNQVPKQLESSTPAKSSPSSSSKRDGVRSQAPRHPRFRAGASRSHSPVRPHRLQWRHLVGRDRYASEVQNRFQMSVPVFEELIRQGLLQDKFKKLVTTASASALPSCKTSSSTKMKR